MPCASASRRATRAARGGTPLANFSELGRKGGVVDADQPLVGCDDRAFLHEQVQDDAALKRLHHLHLPRRHDAAVAALDLVEDGVIRPGDAGDDQRQGDEQQHARGPRRAQFDRGPDVVGEREIRVPHGPA